MPEAAELTVVGRQEGTVPTRASRPRGSSPLLAMLGDAINAGQPIDVIREIKNMVQEIAEDEARKAFIAARAAAKLEIPVIQKNKHVGFKAKTEGKAATDYWHEDLGEIARTIDPILGKHGLSYEFVPQQTGGAITVTCILSHEGGYSKAYPMTAGTDNSGNKNSIQAVGSTATYLSRYTLKMALGLAASRDDDGALADQTAAEAVALSDEQCANLRDLIEQVGADIAKFCAYMKVESLVDIPASQYQRAVAALEAKRVRS